MAYRLRVTIDELMQACDTIHDELCIGCPIESECLREASVEEVWNSVSEKRLQEFINLADKIKYPEEVITDEDIIAFNADMSRQDDWVYREE